jgi:hypothetical protein
MALQIAEKLVGITVDLKIPFVLKDLLKKQIVQN